MKRLHYLLILGLCANFFISCDENPEPLQTGKTYDKGVLIVNEGNFLSGDGEITHYNPETGEIIHNLYQKVNGVILAAYIEQVRVFGDQAYIVDSNQGSAKVVVVDKASFVEKGRVEGLEIPRDLAVMEKRLFIADWGEYDDQGTYTNPASFVAVSDLPGGEVTDKITVPSRPESILEFKGSIFVACQESQEILKINPASLEITERVQFEAMPVKLLVSNDKLMLYSRLDQGFRLDEVNPENLSFSGKAYEIPNSTSLIFDGEGNALVLTSSYSEDFSYTENKILYFSLSGTGPVNTIYEARNLKGIGLDQANRQLYIADDNGIQGNGTVIITDLLGEEIQKLEVGRVPSEFHFY